MRSITLIAFLAFVVQVHAQDKVVDNLSDNLVDKLADAILEIDTPSDEQEEPEDEESTLSQVLGLRGGAKKAMAMKAAPMAAMKAMAMKAPMAMKATKNPHLRR